MQLLLPYSCLDTVVIISGLEVVVIHWTELFEMERFLHLTVCKQKNCTYAKLNCLK